jgi:hypothetical protein
MERIILKDKVFFIGKIKEIQAALRQAAKEYKTLKEYINGNLN